MRIALVVTGGFDRSGRERVIPALLALVERLSRAHEVHVFVVRGPGPAGSYRLAGAAIHDLGSPSGLPRQLAALAARMRGIGTFDVVHGWWVLPGGLLAAALGRRLRIPSVVTCDSGEFVSLPDIGYGLQGRWRGRLALRLALRLATCVTVCSRHQATLARAHGIAPLVVPLGVDTTRFPPRADSPVGPPFRVINVASLNPVKDHATLLGAVARLNRSGLDVRLDLVGEDTLGGRLQAEARTLGLADRVTFHGFRPADALPALYGASHLFVQSSRHEAAGIAVLEAASIGLPLVGSDVGHVADLAPEAAVAVPPRDAVALADAVAGLLLDPVRRRDLATRAAAWTHAHDADWSARQFDDLYAHVRRPHLRPA